MRFIVQRRSDEKYQAATGKWVPSPKNAKLFWTQTGAEAFCFTQDRFEDFDVLMRMPTGAFVRINQTPLRPTGVPSALGDPEAGQRPVTLSQSAP